MTLTLPTIVSSAYVGTTKDFLTTKLDRSGAARMEYFVATIPAVTVITTLIGLVPFNAGARIIINASSVNVDDLDTSTNVTFDLGWTYYDSTLGTSNANALAAASTAAQTGTQATLLKTSATMSFVAVADGWLTATMSGGSTVTQGTFFGQYVLAYDTAG